MDLVTGSKAVYVATTHCDKKGRPKLIQKCTLPLTGKGVVSVIVTEFCLLRKIDGRMVLCEIAPEVTPEELKANTPMEYEVSPDLAPMKGMA
jgi:3-oxoacid CoA-transferase subunit B/acetate CoA/acetoacetate CoA-transferase beta subunit